MTEKDWQKRMRLGRGSDRGIFIEAHKTENDEVWLTGNYDYDLTEKGKYYVTIRVFYGDTELSLQVSM